MIEVCSLFLPCSVKHIKATDFLDTLSKKKLYLGGEVDATLPISGFDTLPPMHIDIALIEMLCFPKR